MTTTQILLFVTKDDGEELTGPIEPGKRFVFTQRSSARPLRRQHAGKRPAAGPGYRPGGHTFRIRDHRPNRRSRDDRFFPRPSLLFQYEATYKFNTLDDTPLQKGQVTARGVFLVDSHDLNALEPPVRFAITGGTGPYSTAHGTITEGVPDRSKQAARYRAVSPHLCA